MDNWDEPLPKHTKFDYYECYAKVVLEELYPEEFKNLEIKDKPDLQMKYGGVGVEVTNSVDKDQLKAEGLYIDIEYNRVRNATKAVEEIKKCGCNLKNGILIGKTSSSSFKLILEAFDKKLEKLNSGNYRYFDKNYLFVFSDIHVNDRMVMEAIQDMRQKQISIKRQYNKVFVLVPGYFYSLNLHIGSYEKIRIDFRLQGVQADRARELVEEYEKRK